MEKEQIELETRRLLAVEVVNYREYLEKQFFQFKWCIVAIVVFGFSVFILFFGKTYSEIESSVKARISEYSIQLNLKERMEETVKKELISKETKKIIYDTTYRSITEITKNEINEMVTPVISQKVAELKGLDLTNTLSDVPIGTIVASVLLPSVFGKIFEGDADADVKRTLWILADGQSVEGSKYYLITRNKYCPDLRGMFLRGVNSGRNDGKQDVENNRLPGSFQDQSLQSHSHKVSSRYNENSGNDWALVHGPNANGPHGKPSFPAGGEETRPKNIAVYYYIKIN